MENTAQNVYNAKPISANYIIEKYGSDLFLNNLKDFFKDYEDSKLKLRNIYISDGYIYRFEFFVLNEEDKEKIKNVEETHSRVAQSEIFQNIGRNFSDKILLFIKNRLIEEVEIINRDIELEENKVRAHPLTISTFHYLKNAGILRFELLF